jgi:hypothetical protein
LLYGKIQERRVRTQAQEAQSLAKRSMQRLVEAGIATEITCAETSFVHLAEGQSDITDIDLSIVLTGCAEQAHVSQIMVLDHKNNKVRSLP